MFPWNWKMPFGKQNEHSIGGSFSPEHFQKYVDQMMNQMFPPQIKEMMSNPSSWSHRFNQHQGAADYSASPFSEKVFETHDDVFIRLTIEDKSWLHQMKISYTRNQCMIMDAPAEGDTWTIPLPSLVRKKGAKTVFKDNILEIKLPKSVEWQETEIELPPY
ncbi:MAG TPA: Hsp20/alpha crystallin family protein [Bacillus sp. (in: firmicutes)]|uniref:Hsp20/alpha crystallin family protein n=1 Tax=Bacillus litorisediminis TaxID=2922713 RepID=UPI001FADD971|nr:Hsp20/alpha crystallin family protein [Bacillus litorisediminis]HWO76264.1 Hsp20/alpha crystallin family protein [Bacillus sp. (in: firmicutes)]